jgi:4-hydroxybenzoate polyprenyltransferase
MALLKRARPDTDRSGAPARAAAAPPEKHEEAVATQAPVTPMTPVTPGSSATPRGSTSAAPRRRATRRARLGSAWPVLLLRAAHPRQGLLTAAGVALAALLAGRSLREVGLVLATVVVGQAVLGWHNDLVDRDRDRRHQSPGKPIAEGLLDAGTVWFSLVCGLLLLVPLSVSNGLTAGGAYVVSVVVGLLGNVVLRRTLFSWVTWAVSFALLPAFLSYGGWGGASTGSAPQVLMVVLAALLGVGVHVLASLRGLVVDHEDGWRSLPLRIALRTGAARLLVISLAWTVVVVAAMLVTGSQVGLAR